MQIVAGACRGMKLHSPPGEGTRPTGAKAREAIMQMLSFQLEGALVVDFFAGSGAMGLEALSRGCERCYFVEFGREALAAIDKNLKELARRLQVQQISGQSWQVVRQRAVRGLGMLLPQLEQFQGDDIILYADPPYGPPTLDWIREATQLLYTAQIAATLTFVVESACEDGAAVAAAFAERSARWELLKSRAYGKAMVHFYRLLPAA